MEPYNANQPLYAIYRNGTTNTFEDKPEQIYSDPEIVMKNSNNEKYAVKYIMEKYDSLRCLNSQIDNMHISSDSGDSVAKDSLSGTAEDPAVDYDDDDYVQEDHGELSEQDIVQVEVFFRSHKTYVSVCHCLANLYFTMADQKTKEWELARTGIPVLLLDKGDTKARNKRMLQIVLAEKGSGFVLWKDIIDNLSNYKAEESCTFHTMYLSSDHRKMAGLSFDIPDAAEKFLREIEQLTSDPLNISLSVPKQKKKKQKAPKKEKVKQPRKCDISTPCCFQHVTNVALDDKKKLFSMATLLSPGERVNT
ncbi:uncharacterized protein LOC129229332 isoform X1 [Uloborus diversus]|uniref:uncharacterized protein LOC129229332 isoform X1 n=1 Tax=Uloborus diversus TaxID=327109 RepID=UPI00240A27EA|nr:uncharacterized protein LOC129229332 isoform X1 [Uloborus diversus]XP_054719600.1 uncharacterized protein LOC129229332 isoform X2 [Uloborus diversus]XP_054719601.1 uncharacterized protein LOC129229332 isoform X1 [Uloborus diversus]